MKSENLGRCGRQNMLWPYLKIWEWELIFSHAVKAISLPGIRSPCPWLSNSFKTGGLVSIFKVLANKQRHAGLYNIDYLYFFQKPYDDEHFDLQNNHENNSEESPTLGSEEVEVKLPCRYLIQYSNYLFEFDFKVIKLFNYLADQFPSMWSEWLRTMMKSILDPRHVATTFKV